MDSNTDLDKVIDAADGLSSEVGKHPALIGSAITKKGSQEEFMDVDHGDLFSQIETATKHVSDIDELIKEIQKSIRTKYSPRYPELNLPDPMQYIMTVQLLGNQPKRVIEDIEIKEQLSQVLDSKMYLLVTMSAATTQGVKIEPDIMKRIMKACAGAIHLSNLRSRLLYFIELNMAKIAPNLSEIVGASIAAKLVAQAGGIKELAHKPSCNLKSGRISNMELNIGNPSKNLIYECELVQQIPIDHTNGMDIRRRAVKWVTNKCVLAARCDDGQTDKTGKFGREFREKIQSLIDKELEPPPKKAVRPLPAPIEKSGKKRGGKRVRRNKERFAQTQLRTEANRINFGDIGDDAYQNDLGLGRTQLTAMRKLRAPQINKKTNITLSKGTQKRLAQQNAAASIVMKDQKQGIEIFNPGAAESFSAGTSGESSKYFSNSTPFLQASNGEKSGGA